ASTDLVAVQHPDVLALEPVGQRVKGDLRGGGVEGAVDGRAERLGLGVEVHRLGIFDEVFSDNAVLAKGLVRLFRRFAVGMALNGLARGPDNSFEAVAYAGENLCENVS